jgi:hypothetical protein
MRFRFLLAASIIVVSVNMFISVPVVHAENGGGASLGSSPFVNASNQLQSTRAKAGVGTSSVEDIVGRLIKGAISLVGVFFFGYLVWAGYLWMTAHGEEEKITQAKKMISGAIIGLAITLAAYAITIFVVTRLTQASGTAVEAESQPATGAGGG